MVKAAVPGCKIDHAVPEPIVVIELTGYRRRYGASEGSDRRLSNLLRCVLRRAALPGCHHVWLEQRSLEEDMVVRQRLVYVRQNLMEWYRF